MDHDELITTLASESSPIKPLRPMWYRAFWWIGVAGTTTLSLILWRGVRVGCLRSLADPMFVTQTIALLILVISALAAALLAAIPGRIVSRGLTRSIVLSAATWMMAILVQLFLEWHTGTIAGVSWRGAACCGELLTLALAPTLLLAFLILRAAPTRGTTTGRYLLLATGALAALASQFTCGFLHPLHLLAWHVAPVAALALLGGWMGKRWLRW